jgi:hypothetical protein
VAGTEEEVVFLNECDTMGASSDELQALFLMRIANLYFSARRADKSERMLKGDAVGAIVWGLGD